MTQAHQLTDQGRADPSRIETTVETGLEYQPGEPVNVRVIRRGPRTEVTDSGAAFERAGSPQGWQAASEKIEREFVVNVSRHGVISLPVVRVGPPEDQIVQRIGTASLAFYQELLDLT